MSISVPCPGCGRKLKAPDAAAGKRARCPDCQTVVTLPAVAGIGLTAAQSPPPPPPPEKDPFDEYDIAPDPVQAAPMITRAPAPPPPPPAPVKPSVSQSPTEWKIVRGGLTCVFFGMLGLAACLVLTIVIAFSSAMSA